MKLTKTLIVFFALILSGLGFSQTATVQVIHNSPDLSIETVDLYIDNIKFVDNFRFRTSTNFVEIGAGVNVKINIAPSNSQSVADSVFELNTTFTSGETYILVADGILSDSGYSQTENFGIQIYDAARQNAANSNEIELLVHHGSPDAPAVDVNVLAPQSKLADDIAYTEFQGYVSVPSGDYRLEVTTADETNSVGQFIAPLKNIGLEGQAVTVLASGFLNPSQNSNGPSFGLWATRPGGGNLIRFPQPTANVQIIHNSADLAAEFVDVYVNGALLVDDFEFRTATPFVNIPANIPLRIEIAPGTSSSSQDAIYELNTLLERDKSYILIANGNISSAGYTQTENFNIEVFPTAKQSSSNAGVVDILAFHGATDAPSVDIDVVAPQVKIVDDISYTDFQGYVTVSEGDYTLNVTTSDGTTIVGQYIAPLRNVSLGGKAITVLASGFLDPSQNSDGPSFGLWAARPSGGNLIEFRQTTASVQVIHNSADLNAQTVDVYLNDNLLLDNFNFRTATPFVNLPAGISLSVKVAPGNSASSADAIFEQVLTLDRNKRYIVVADGNISASGYTQTENFSLEVYDMARVSAQSSGNTDILVHHGATDAPAVDVRESVSQIVLVNDISYTGFSNYVQLPTNDYFIDVTTADELSIVASYLAPLSTLGLNNRAITVLASGFLDPVQNSNGPEFGLWVATSTGGALVELPKQVLNTNDFNSLDFSVFPRIADNELTIKMKQAGANVASIYDLSGRLVLETEIKTIENTLDITQLNSGMYLLTISTEDNGSNSVKFYKK